MAGLWSDHFPAVERTPERCPPRKTNGRWSELFPSSAKPASPASASASPDQFQRCLLCPVCSASCRLFTSNTARNPNRQFYKCSATTAIDHDFFKWADKVNPDEFIDVPYCRGCTAGVCRVKKETFGPNAGRILFMCRVKEGEGSCGYRVWQDELRISTPGQADERITSPLSSTMNGNQTWPTNTVLVDKNRQSNERANNDSPVIDSSQNLNCHGVTFRKTERENQSNGSSSRGQRVSDERETSFQSSSPTVDSNHTKPANTHLVEENNQCNEREDNESPVVDTLEHLHCKRATSRKMEHLKCQENQNSEYSRRAHRLSDVTVTLFQSPTVNSDHTEPANTDLVGENNQSDEGPDNESPMIDILLGVTSKKAEVLKFQENQPNESSSRRSYKRSRHGDLKAPSSLVCSQSLTVGSAMNSVSLEHCWMVSAIRQNLSSQLQGWWGRLAFHPIRSLMTNASIPLTYYVSSPLDSTFTSQDKILVNSGDLTTLTKILLGIETYNKPLLNPCHNVRAAFDVSSSCSDPSTETTIQNAMSKSISKAFGHAAEHLQNDFLALLDEMDIKDYEAMSRAAEATFAALDRLLFDHRDFKERTDEYIHCATSLAEIEQSMPGNDYYQKLIEHCSSERTRLDEINSALAKAVVSVNDNKKRLKSLQDEISSTMDWLFQIEAELSFREVEMRNMEHELEKICKSKEVLEEKCMIAANELERSKKLLEEKEAERNVAKAAFERARGLLRG